MTLTQDRVRELFEYFPETGELFWRPRASSEFTDERHAKRWNTCFAHTQAGHENKRGYRRIQVGDHIYLAHRIIWLYVFGVFPKVIDHIDGNPRNNRISNMRNVTIAENQRNLTISKSNTSGVQGIWFDTGVNMWRARINTGRRALHVGSFDTQRDAIVAYNVVKKLLGFHENHGKRKTQ